MNAIYTLLKYINKLKRNFFCVFGMAFFIIILIGCSNETLNNSDKSESDVTYSDKTAKEQRILSKDDAEALIYNKLSDEEKINLTVDYLKEEGTKYFIYVYGTINGKKVEKNYTVDFNTEKIQQLE